MPSIKLLFLWHMHQPFYKDLVTGEYRLPWVRLHALKDYYGMVKLLDEFPSVHQTFNLVPSLISQIEDYASGAARDPFLIVAAKPAAELTPEERRFALQYLFQANVNNLIGRYPRYQDLYRKFESFGCDPALAEKQFSTQDLTDLQVFSQLAWFDEFFLDKPDGPTKKLMEKGAVFSRDDQKFVISKQQEIIAAVLPAYASAAKRGLIEISTSPFYHPILPLLCDTDVGRVSSPGLPLPIERFSRPEDAREQLRRGLDLHERVFGKRPQGVWPSEGSVSEEALAIAQELGVTWMATDEGVLGRSLGSHLDRGSDGVLARDSADKLYRIYRYANNSTRMNLVFRDHSLSDLIGFVYAGMPPREATQHFIDTMRKSTQSILNKGLDAVVPVILDGENAWEYFPKSGREFLRCLYQAISDDSTIQALTVSEAIAQTANPQFGTLRHLTPGSWINANFNIWIGAPEDNRAWDYLTAARDFYEEHLHLSSEPQRALAYEELLIAEGSDWNWWYGPEHHTANDTDFDHLYRKHLSNVYQALGASPPEYLAQPIARVDAHANYSAQTAFIHPAIDGLSGGYFDWLGAAHYTADRRTTAMHGKRFLLNACYAGFDERNFYCRLDFTDEAFSRALERSDSLVGDFDIGITMERVGDSNRDGGGPGKTEVRMEAQVSAGKLKDWRMTRAGDPPLGAEQAAKAGAMLCLEKVLEAQVPMAYMQSRMGDLIRLRFSIWQSKLPLDSLPLEGWIELKISSEAELAATAKEDHWKA